MNLFNKKDHDKFLNGSGNSDDKLFNFLDHFFDVWFPRIFVIGIIVQTFVFGYLVWFAVSGGLEETIIRILKQY